MSIMLQKFLFKYQQAMQTFELFKLKIQSYYKISLTICHSLALHKRDGNNKYQFYCHQISIRTPFRCHCWYKRIKTIKFQFSFRASAQRKANGEWKQQKNKHIIVQL